MQVKIISKTKKIARPRNLVIWIGASIGRIMRSLPEVNRIAKTFWRAPTV